MLHRVTRTLVDLATQHINVSCLRYENPTSQHIPLSPSKDSSPKYQVRVVCKMDLVPWGGGPTKAKSTLEEYGRLATCERN